MQLPIEDLTPRQIVAELDKYIVGQAAAKRAVAIALRNRYRRQQLPEHERDDILPKNILMIGPTGVGKTEIARRLAQLARAPFIKVEATKFTEVGYVGRDVDSMIRELVATSVRLVEREKIDEIRQQAEEAVVERLIDLLEDRFAPVPEPEPAEEPEHRQVDVLGHSFSFPSYPTEPDRDRETRRDGLRKRIIAGEFERELVEVDVEEAGNPFVQVFTNQGIEEMGLDSPMGAFPSRRSTRKVTVGQARTVIFDEEAKQQIDRPGVHAEAIFRAEQTGIIFLDEIDKVAGKQGGSGPDVSREGVQRDLLPLIEGSTVQTKFGPVRTDHILFVAAGAFHMSKPSDLIPELQGRLPIRVELDNLSESDFRKILREPKNALTRQYQLLLSTEGVDLTFQSDALDELARIAIELNEKTENIGARRLHTVMERVLENVLFAAPDSGEKTITITPDIVRAQLIDLLQNPHKARSVV